MEKIVDIIAPRNIVEAHSILGCDNSPILLESKENEDGPHRAKFA